MKSEQEYAKILAKNLKRIMFMRDKSQADLARDLKISKATLSSWMVGTRLPRMSKIDMLCNYFGIERSDLLEEKMYTASRKRIPVLGSVAAGIPIEAIEDILDWEEITEEMSRTGEYFGLKIRGDSMMPRIAEGDVVIVKQQSDADSGDVVIAQVNGDSATCKKLYKRKDGISLVSFNPMYEPMDFSEEQVLMLPVTIIGRVVENRQKY